MNQHLEAKTITTNDIDVMTESKIEISEDGQFVLSKDPEFNQVIEELNRYVEDFRALEQKIDQIPWIYRTILFPVGMAIEWYWIRQMGKLNEEFSKKHDLGDA